MHDRPHPEIERVPKLSRREFVHRAAFSAAAMAIPSAVRLSAAGAEAPRRALFSGVGMTAPLSRAAELEAAGADYFVPGVADFLMPDAPESEFERQLELVASGPLPVLGCNNFLRDRRLRSTGPDADHPAVLAFAEIAFRRLARAGGKFIGFGSSGSRRLPDGWPKERADEQFRELLRGMAPLAAAHGIIVAVEQLRAAECNYLNQLSEVVAVVSPVDHPNIRVLADLFHMAVMGDTPDDLERAMPWVALMEIAEKENRAVPGVAGDDFRPFFAVLARGGYHGNINIEGNGAGEQIKNAFATIRRQAADVMASIHP